MFELTEEQRDLRDLAAKVAAEQYAPHAREWDAGGTPTMQRTRIASEYLGRRFDQRR